MCISYKSLLLSLEDVFSAKTSQDTTGVLTRALLIISKILSNDRACICKDFNFFNMMEEIACDPRI